MCNKNAINQSISINERSGIQRQIFVWQPTEKQKNPKQKLPCAGCQTPGHMAVAVYTPITPTHLHYRAPLAE